MSEQNLICETCGHENDEHKDGICYHGLLCSECNADKVKALTQRANDLQAALEGLVEFAEYCNAVVTARGSGMTTDLTAVKALLERGRKA